MRERVFYRDGIKSIPYQRRIGHVLWHGLWMAAVLCWGGFGAVSASALDVAPSIKAITLLSDPIAIQVTLKGQAPFRVMRVDARNLMIAFKGVRLAEKVVKTGGGEADPLIRKVKIDQLPDDVISIRVSTGRDIRDIRANWDPKAQTLTARLILSDPDPSIPCLARRPEFVKPADLHQKLAIAAKAAGLSAAASKGAPSPAPTAAPKTAAAPATPPAQVLGRPAPPVSDADTEGLSGSTDDLLLLMARGAPCPDHREFEEALRECRGNNWQRGFDLLSGAVSDKVKGACQEKRLYLKAYACFRSNRLGQDSVYLDALSYFQDAMSYFPSSSYTPYAMASIAKIYDAMKNYAEAKGYFKILLDTYKSYPGRPEVLFDLGTLYAKNHELKPCISVYREFLDTYPHSQFALDVKLGLGKALYDTNQYARALALMNEVLSEDPKKAFKNGQLLLVIGNCYYQLGKFKEAREALSKAYNYFPDASDNPTTLTRIGDTYRDTGHPDKAKTIYQIVMDKYPGTDGYIISAMRRAALLENDNEKEAAYEKVIDTFPDHPVAKLAVVKLADLQNRQGLYRKSIETIRPVLTNSPGDLASDAAYIMQSAFAGLLKQLMKDGAYAEVIGLKQKEWAILRRFDNPDLFRMMGLAYLKGHLYPEARALLDRAKDLSGEHEPPELSYELGVALQETGKVEPAIEQFGTYIEKDPRGEHVKDAYCRMARLFIAQRDFKNALTVLQSAQELSTRSSEKIQALQLTAEAWRGIDRYDRAVESLLEVRTLLEKSPEKSTEFFTDTCRQLGEDYMRLKNYGKAADAFLAAVSKEDNSPSPSLLMQLGEAYQKAGHSDQAMKTYSRVLTLDDDFWKYLAQERLRGMKVANRLRSEGV